MIEAKQTHSGQFRRYDDYYRIWEIETDVEDTGGIVNWCFNNLYGGKVLPESDEWHRNIAYGGDRHDDISYYFKGYYSLKKKGDIYEFKICEPYAD